MDGPNGQFCEVCGEEFWSLKSERRIATRLTEYMAEHDSGRVVAAELASVNEAAKRLRMTVQGVHKMMETGRLRYVMAGGRAPAHPQGFGGKGEHVGARLNEPLLDRP